jgi:peptide deformylase
MSLLQILYFPDEKLRAPCENVTVFDENLNNIISDMFETMYKNEGIGLAAPQVGIHKRICVIDIEGNKDPKDQIVLINPTIIQKCGETGIDEGCLSVPGLRAHVDRALKVKVSALNLKGEEFTIEAEDLLAICIQHELDHLDGKLFIDYLSPLKVNLYRKKAEKLARERKNQSKNKA